MTVRIINGDCRTELAGLPAKSARCCVTSPPYFAQRDYGVAGQIGLEPTPEAYVAEMVAVFRDVRRVLTDDGTLWLNIGDSYNNRTRIRPSSHKPIIPGTEKKTWAQSARDGEVRMSISSPDFKEKDMFGIPWALATALRADGWFLRQEIIWNKPVAKLDVSGDRPSTHHEQIFLLSKSKIYHFDKSALPPDARGSVWTVSATGHNEHGASFPAAIVEPCILAGSLAGDMVIDPFGGAGTTGLVAANLSRSATLIELNGEFADVARRRIHGDLFATTEAIGGAA